jgi:histidinol-phosphate aminotransferase
MPLVPPYIADLRPYEPGRSADSVRQEYGLARVVKLASNENPLGPSPLALEAIRSQASRISLYPQSGLPLRTALAEFYGLRVENVTVGSGSDSIIASIVRTFLCDDDEILTTEAAFGGFQVTAKSRGVAYKTVPYRNWHYDLDALAEAITPRTKIIYLANPNNPTGTIFSRREFEAFYRSVPERVLIILDEAYFEYAKSNPDYPDSLRYRLDNVITLRTFSKAYGLAGLRAGYGFAHENLIANLSKVKLPFEPGTLAEIGAATALKDQEFVRRSVLLNERLRHVLRNELLRRGFEVIPSEANFVMIVFPEGAAARRFTTELMRRGVIVRSLESFGLPACVRVSVGTDEEIAFLLDAVDALNDLYISPGIAFNSVT